MTGTDTPALGRYGVFTFAGVVERSPRARGELAAWLEELGFGAIWLANATAEAAAPFLAATSKVIVGTAIQCIWTQDAASTAAQYAELEAAHPGRFVLGLGVGHPQRNAEYQRPFAALSEYLDGLDDPAGGKPVPAGRRVLAALGPRMLGLARDRTAGTLPYLVTAEHVAEARATLGEGPLLAPEVGVVLATDPTQARTLARGALARYLPLTNYTRNWFRGGFTEEDLAGGGSDRLIDALFAWGDEEQIRARLDAFHAAGADHVVLQPIEEAGPSPDGLRRLGRLLR